MIKNILTILACHYFLMVLSAQEYRYATNQSINITVYRNLVYTTVDFLQPPYQDESQTTKSALHMDLFAPSEISVQRRPAIIFAHGGAFVAGSKEADDMTAFCDLFAEKGYVTAKINYRLGMTFFDNLQMHAERAQFRALQDARSAIRYLRANADAYGIDTSKIYWVGSSAGAFMGLNAAFMDNAEKLPSCCDTAYNAYSLAYNAPDLGAVDVGDNLSYNAKPNAVVSLWGGVSDTTIINSYDLLPVLLVHGKADNIVPFSQGAPFGLSTMGDVYGGGYLNDLLKRKGATWPSSYFIEDQGHEFYGTSNGNWEDTVRNEYWNMVVDRTAQFFQEIGGLTTTATSHKPSSRCWSITTNNGGINVVLTKVAKSTSVCLYTSLGQRISFKRFSGVSEFSFSVDVKRSGIYLLQLNADGIKSNHKVYLHF